MIKKVILLLIPCLILLSSCETEKGTIVDEQLILSSSTTYNEETCGKDIYPCPPYGTKQYQIAKDVPFLPANQAAEDITDIDGINYFHYFYKLKDQGYKLLLITTTTGWCDECKDQMAVFPAIYNQYGAGSVDPRVAFLIVVTETAAMEVADSAYATWYSGEYNLDNIAPVTNDSNNIFILYMNSIAYPNNIFIDLEKMQIIAYATALHPEQSFADKLDEMLTLTSK
jgi:hypothetical protein